MKLLVTGGAGFIGSNFINYWLRKYPDDAIINLDKMTYAANPLTVQYHEKNFPKNYEMVKGDILDTKLVNELMQKIDTVVHFAAESHVDRSVTNPGEFVLTNVVGTNNILNAATNYKKRYHHVSTDEVFGTLELGSDEKFTEDSPYDPRSPYSASKAGSDHLVRAYHETFGLEATITNCSNNFGPFNFPEKVIPLFITRFIQDKPVPIYAKGEAVRDYLYVEDHAKAIDLVLKKGKIGETYTVGGDSERNTVQVADTILEKLGKTKDKEKLVKFTKDRPGHDPRYAIDHSKITKELGWKPNVTFEEGIELTIQWYKDNEAWWRPISAKAEEVAEKYLANAK